MVELIVERTEHVVDFASVIVLPLLRVIRASVGNADSRIPTGASTALAASMAGALEASSPTLAHSPSVRQTSAMAGFSPGGGSAGASSSYIYPLQHEALKILTKTVKRLGRDYVPYIQVSCASFLSLFSTAWWILHTSFPYVLKSRESACTNFFYPTPH